MKNVTRNKLENLVLATSIAVLVVILATLMSVLSILFLNNMTSDFFFLVTRVCLLIGVLSAFWIYSFLYNIPLWRLVKNLYIPAHKYRYIVFIITSLVALILIILGIYFIDWNSYKLFILSFILSSISEEFLFRGLIEYHLCQYYTTTITILIQAMLFAFIGHQSFDIVTNLIVRVPLGILLSYLRRLTSLYSPCILLHALYDTLLFIN